MADSTHSGSTRANIIAGMNVVHIDVSGLDTSKIFAVCYTEGSGGPGVAWTDSGMRLQISKVRAPFLDS